MDTEAPELSESQHVDDVIAMLRLVNLSGVRFYHFQASADDSEGEPVVPDQFTAEYALAIRSTETTFDFRCGVTIPFDAGQIVADAAIRYTAQTALDVPVEVVQEFGSEVAIMALFPYLREAVDTLARRVGVEAVLPMIGRGQLTYEEASETTDQ